MACPEEDTFAQLLQGLLTGDERARLERHLDGCVACTELVAELGKAFGPETRRSEPPRAVAPAVERPAPPDLPVLTRIELFAAFVHSVITLKLVSLLVGDAAPVALLVVLAGFLLGPVGAAAAALAAWGTSRSAAWGRRLAVVHACIALPSIVLTPLGVYVLFHHRTPR